MPLNIYRRQSNPSDTLAGAIGALGTAGAGIINAPQQAQANSLAQMKTLMDIKKLQTETQEADPANIQKTIQALSGGGSNSGDSGNSGPPKYKVKATYNPKRGVSYSVGQQDPLADEMKQQRLQSGSDKEFESLGKDLDPSAYRSGAFGISKQSFDRAERLDSLYNVAEALPGGLDKRQTEEMAIGLNSMLSGGNQGAMEQVKSLVPQTMQGDARKIVEWVTSNPTGLEQQKFTERLKQTIDREKATFGEQIKRTQYSRLGKYPSLRGKNPQAWDSLVRGYGIDPSDYDTWAKSGYKPISAVQGGDTYSGPPKASSGLNNLKSKYGLD